MSIIVSTFVLATSLTAVNLSLNHTNTHSSRPIIFARQSIKPYNFVFAQALTDDKVAVYFERDAR